MDDKMLEMVHLVNNMNTKDTTQSNMTKVNQEERTVDPFLMHDKIKEMVLGINRKS